MSPNIGPYESDANLSASASSLVDLSSVTLADMVGSASSIPLSPLSGQQQANVLASSYPPQSYVPDYGYQPSTAPSLPSHYVYVLGAKELL